MNKREFLHRYIYIYIYNFRNIYRRFILVYVFHKHMKKRKRDIYVISIKKTFHLNRCYGKRENRA